MRLYRHFTGLDDDARGSAVAIGNFDGIHLGHQTVIGHAQAAARRLDAPSAVLTFEPHPRSFFRPADPPFRLTPLRPKTHMLETLGLDLLFVLHFDRSMANRPAEDFVREVLMALGAPRGPFGAGFSRPTNLMTGARNDRSTREIATSDVVRFAPAISSQSISLGSGGGTLSACVGPTGQLRVVDPGNNAGWAEECVADGFRPTEIQLGGNSALQDEMAAAMERDPITTCDVSCSGGNPNVACDNEIPHPFALTVSAGNRDQDRWQSWMVTQGFLFGFVDNILVLGGDPTEPSTVALSFD